MEIVKISVVAWGEEWRDRIISRVPRIFRYFCPENKLIIIIFLNPIYMH